MNPARLSAAAALLGGLLWIAHALLGGGSDPLPATLHFVGLALIVVAAAVFGSTLVRSDASGMRVVVGLASGLLAMAMIEAFRGTDSGWYDGFWGVVAALIGGIALLRGRRAEPQAPRPGGAHSR
ncbi:hypothetical protein L2K70_15705 [Nocardioides KLBMP 9356]|uniref:DUF4383 domain-containing protein n=1 Tax=Nocardioides potassii TaxID=2911371 RepID=A0ABS9HFD7_9ACTN|nr:hypothetical protein [Nocardioides potassii]MCF6379062.1 hypothetical protein [Nocardioides potassii]